VPGGRGPASVPAPISAASPMLSKLKQALAVAGMVVKQSSQRSDPSTEAVPAGSARRGGRRPISLQAAADRPAPAWTVSAVDLTGLHEKAQYLDVALDRSTVSAGDAATPTISVRKLHPKELALVGLVSTLGDASHLWPVAVVMR